MGRDYLLDTVAANLVANDVASALRRLASAQAVYVPAFALAELYSGAYSYA